MIFDLKDLSRQWLESNCAGHVGGYPVVETGYLPVDDDPWKCIPGSQLTEPYIAIPRGHWFRLKPLLELAFPEPQP